MYSVVVGDNGDIGDIVMWKGRYFVQFKDLGLGFLAKAC
jgi:hypothetical protein